MQVVADLPRGAEGPRVARLLLREHFAAELKPAELADTELLVSELVVNAVVHGEGKIRLHMQVDDELIRGEVVDHGPGFEAEIRERGAEELSGRGLWMVATLARRWGVHEGSSHVWFELARADDADHPASPELGVERRPDQLG